ncbi:M50 family metallopeptidase [Microbacterium sp. NE2HP2]|uniref:metalloprotease n=1 Tax=Microbacterium TaxID=33882 RepID=UPI002365C550|nr:MULTISPECIES: M50 family metallopeptidase [Microbacterium]MDD7945385.1 M50 family metallopeptidase [Microbacterium plantarum]WHE36166.1 M50 family metallopeptidase [Microbacterium sp. BDGP8]WRK17449.1 M50 family metallopeptidase [Microbacterium plantarum]
MNGGDTLDLLRDARPQLVDDVRIGPGLWDVPSTRFVMHDARTGWYFRIGEHEQFLVSRMDGVRTVDQLEDEFIEHYERRLTEPLWNSLLGLLAQRGLLVGSATPVQLQSLRDARERERGEARTWLHARMPIVKADRILRRMAVAVRVLDHLAVWLLVWVAAAALVVHVSSNWDVLWPAARSLWTDPVAIAVFIVVMWASLVLHELAHGATAWAYGARDIEIGVMWRFPFISPYCKVDDTMLFHDRSRRVRVALAGVTVSVAVCLPFWPLSLVADGTLATVCAAMMTFGLLTGLINLVPLFHMDGYYALMHALGAFDLEASSRAALVGLARRSREAGSRESGHRTASLVYGLFSLLFMSAMVFGFAVAGYLALQPLLGPWPAVVVVCSGVLATFAIGVLATRRTRAKRRAQTGTRTPISKRWGQT